MTFAGAHTALVTPFCEDGTIDAEAFRNLIDYSLENGIKGVVPTGTTGESPTLSYEEHSLVIELAVKHTKGRGLVIAGTGSNSTREAIAMTQEAQENGADGCLLVSPLLQQALPGRPVRPLPGHRRIDGPSRDSLFHSGTLCH